jgi:hypothetical protein
VNRYPAKIKLTDTAEAVIAEYAVDLMLAELELHQLPPALLEFYVYAYESGRESQQPEIDHLKWDRDLWYFVANNKSKRPGDYYSHLTNELWNEATR